MKKIILSCIFLLTTLVTHGLEISIGQGTVAAKPIAIVPFAGNTGKDKIDFIISSDLKKSGVFAPIAPSAYSERPTNTTPINYTTFQSLHAAYVVSGQLLDAHTIHFAISDTYQQKNIGQYTLNTNNKTLRQAAHEISDIILAKLTGTRGAFAARLAYIYESGDGLARLYKLMISDSDGHAPIVLLSSRAPLMSPRFSPDGTEIAYVTFEGKKSQIVRQNIQTGKRTLVTKEPGINSAPAWSPDGQRISMVLSKDGNPEIYFKDLRSQQLTRVTNNASIDTEPAWSPDGQSIYFTSNRSGTPQLYRIDLHNGQIRQITTAGKYSAGAAISPNGQKIAISRNQGGKFVVGTVNAQTGQFHGVSQGFIDETPRFSPNGKMLIFTSVKNNKAVLKIVNIDGSGEDVLSTSGQIRDPDWSTYLK